MKYLIVFQDKTQKVEAESDDSNDIQQPQRDPSHLDPNTNPDRFSSNIFEEIFQGLFDSPS